MVHFTAYLLHIMQTMYIQCILGIICYYIPFYSYLYCPDFGVLFMLIYKHATRFVVSQHSLSVIGPIAYIVFLVSHQTSHILQRVCFVSACKDIKEKLPLEFAGTEGHSTAWLFSSKRLSEKCTVRMCSRSKFETF